MEIICKVFGHSKTHWPVGLGSSVVFVWCSRCGKEFANESLEMRLEVSNLRHEVQELNKVIEYYKSENEGLQKKIDQYIEIVDRFIENPKKEANNG